MSKTLDTARNSDFGQRFAIFESTISNTLDAIAYSDRGQFGAGQKSIIFYSCDAIGNGNGGQRGAKYESPHFNPLDAVGKSDGSQRFATKESVLTYTRDEKGGSIRHHSLGDNNIPLIAIPLGNDRCCHRFLVEAVFDTFDYFF